VEQRIRSYECYYCKEVSFWSLLEFLVWIRIIVSFEVKKCCGIRLRDVFERYYCCVKRCCFSLLELLVWIRIIMSFDVKKCCGITDSVL
jgi:hypothetical protein